jgi:hypothetical protein
MKNGLRTITLSAALSVVLFSCQKSNKSAPASTSTISSEVLSQIKSKGFSREGVVATNGGFLVEGDIFLTNKKIW